MALVNLGVSIVFCQWWGAIGSALGTAISLVLANGFLINIYYQKKCNIDVISFWKSILRMFKGLVVPIVFGTLIMMFVKFHSFIQLACWIVLYSAIYCINVWAFSMNKYEKELITTPLKKLVLKGK